MSVWQTIKTKVFRINNKTEKDPSASSGDALFDRFKSWFFPHSIFTQQNSYALATNETIFAAVSRLSNSLGSMPVKLMDKDFEPITNSVISDIVTSAPNPNQTSFDFFRAMEVLRDTAGNAYALKEYDDYYQPKALWILDPSRVTPVIESGTKELWYEIQPDEGPKYYAHNQEVLHVKHIHGYGYKGISPIEVLKGTAEFDRKVRSFSLDQIDSAITFSFILKLAGSIDKDKKESILANFRRFYQENGGVLIQESGVEIDPIEKKQFIDTQLFEVEKITRSRVANVYNMPLYLLGEISGVQASSMDTMDLSYVQGTMVPIVRQYEQGLSRVLLTPEDRRAGMYFKFNVNALLRGDMSARGEFYQKGIRSGWFMPNEVRALEDLPPQKGGDKLYMSKDLFPIGDERRDMNEPPDAPQKLQR